MSKKVTFRFNTNQVKSDEEEEFTLEELGIDENLPREQLEKEIEEAWKEWVWNQIGGSWEIVD